MGQILLRAKELKGNECKNKSEVQVAFTNYILNQA